MLFSVTQHFDAEPAAVAGAFADPALYEALGRLPKVGRPDVLRREVQGATTHLEIRYHFTGELSTAARAILDPSKLSWVEVSDHHLSTHEVSFRLQPDHYHDRLTCRGTYRFEAGPGGEGTVRTTEGDLKVRALLVAGQVERAIVSGLQEHLEAGTGVVDEFLRERL